MKAEIELTRYVIINADGKYIIADQHRKWDIRRKMVLFLRFMLFSKKANNYVAFDGTVPMAKKFCRKHEFFIKEVEFKQTVDFGDKS